MSPFDEVVGGMHVERSLFAQFHLCAPWGVRFSTGKQARLVVVAEGGGWLSWAGSKTALQLEKGDCLIIKPGITFELTDARGRSTVACETLLPAHDGRVVEYGGVGARTVLVAGRFSFDPIAAEPLVTNMPPLAHVKLEQSQGELLQATLALIGRETAQDGLGAGLVIDRLTDALFVQVMRMLFSSGCCSSAPNWVTGLTDRRVTKALRAVHADLARPWTVAEMASEAGVSRSSFAAAFLAAVGESPLDYVTNWRIYRAKVLLTTTDESLTEVAGRVGYDSDTALSRAFRRKVGLPPGEFRKSAAARRSSVEA